ncbi:MAG: M56 family metallopeptidase [Clostridia bacterium]|nr:M56 family metallopeptidase [Clostridia bacterium]
MEAIFLTVLNMSLTASWILLALFLLRFLLRRAPRWLFCLLWIPVALRLALPFTVESVLSLLPSGEPIPQNILIAGIPEVHTGIDAVNAVVNPFIAQELAPSTKADVTPALVIALVAAILWIAGIVLLLAHALIGYLRLARRVQISAPLEDSGKINDPRIRICDGIDTPFILGIFRPHIYLPSAMDAAAISHVIAHEKAHLTRLDHWWKPLGYLLLTLHWFNPLVWIAYIFFCRDLETACDEKVIGKMDGEDKAAYSEALLSCSLPKMRITACPLAFGEVGVKGRIKSILHYKKPTVWVIGAVVIAAAVLVVGFWTNPVGTKSPLYQAGIPSSSQVVGQVVVLKIIAPWENTPYPDAFPAIGEDYFYGIDDNGNYYYVHWDNTSKLQEGNIVTVQYKLDKIKFHPQSLDSYGFQAEYEIEPWIVYLNRTSAVHVSSNSYYSYDSIIYDFDKDGIEDECVLGYGPTSGVFTFTFTVKRDVEYLYHDLYYNFDIPQKMYFRISTAGYVDKLQVCMEYKNTTEYYDIIIEDGHTSLRNSKDQPLK